ncbi:ABC transporter permease [Frankia sp. Cas4]|uniref:ABC transporter permease n=1 Tax=Frankia sp. Cas4 TaxID=3073927 RepID=UPI002AD24113|nr:ABC transporter permease [Frankia sp. Cas4]
MATDTTIGPDTLRGPATTTSTDAALAGLDALETAAAPGRPLALRMWSATWPKLGAVAIFLLAWQIVVWIGWKPSYVLPGPDEALPELGHRVVSGDFWSAFARTMQRAFVGYALAVVIGTVVGLAVSRFALLRTAVGSFITALQTMPSIVWFPLAILLFRLTEGAILFVVVLGAAPSVANGVISGIDYVPPLLTRLGRSMGARGLKLYRFVVAPAALPSVVAGLKQGWAFAWRSLMAGELLVIVPGHPSIGSDLENSRQFLDATGVIASMLTIFAIGVLVDAAFNTVDRRMRARRGLLPEQSS